MDETIMSEHAATRQGSRRKSPVENPDAGGALTPRLGRRRPVGCVSVVGQKQMHEEASNTSSVPAARVGAAAATTPRSRLRATTCTLGIGLVLVLASGVNLAVAHAVCAGDRPCFDKVYMDGPTTLVATWHHYSTVGHFIQFRYSSPGGPEPQERTSGDEFRIYRVQPGTTFTLKVQGCEEFVLGPSDCSPWDTTTFTVPMPSFGPLEPESVAGPPRKVEPQQPSTTCGTACQPGAEVPQVLLPSPGPR